MEGRKRNEEKVERNMFSINIKKTIRETNCSPGSIVYTEEEMLNMSDMETEGEGH